MQKKKMQPFELAEECNISIGRQPNTSLI